jgi:alanyl-tRNA synthetase
MTPNELRESYFNHMRSKGSVIIPSASLLPENDPTTLFTGSGMQPMIGYLLGEKHPSGDDLSDSQKCLRTGDLEETGDNSHLTFFEMIGRWKLKGDPKTYKRNQIEWIWDWQINKLGLNPQNLYISVFEGDKDLGIDRDDEAIAIWTELFNSVGIDPMVEDDPWTYGCSRGGRIFCYDAKENWWSRAGVPSNMPVGEPGGPDSEMFYDFDPSGDEKDHPATDSERFLEIGNNVFMAYIKTDKGFEPMDAPNIDYGGGLERICAAINNDADVYKTPFFAKAIEKIAELSDLNYEDSTREFRIILDHIRGATFLIGDGAIPSNVDAGYITRRLIRRAIRTAKKINIHDNFTTQLSNLYIGEASAYPTLQDNRDMVINAIQAEEDKFRKTLESGEREILKFLNHNDDVSGKDAFFFYETYGFPLELTIEVLEEHNRTLSNPEQFEAAEKEHSEKSRTAAAGKFKGGLADQSEITTAYHSATHLMLAGLRKVVGDHVHQKGSNITGERIRFDFSNPEKVTRDLLDEVEAYVNEGIAANATVTMREMAKQDAMDQGIEGSFWEKYPDTVKVYSFIDEAGNNWSEELCGGPHIDETSDIAKFGRFKIKKEESSSSGVRRVKAVLIGE